MSACRPARLSAPEAGGGQHRLQRGHADSRSSRRIRAASSASSPRSATRSRRARPSSRSTVPDLLQANSTLISAAGRAGAHHQQPCAPQATLRDAARSRRRISSRPISDQQTAEGALRAARDAVRIFGKTDAEIDRIVADRMADPSARRQQPDRRPHHRAQRRARPVRAARQSPAPFIVADISTMWMLANVTGDRRPAFQRRPGSQGLVVAFPEPRFRRHDHHHRSVGRPEHPPHAGALGDRRPASTSCGPACSPTSSSAPATRCARSPIPLDGVVREGDGTMTAWVTTDRRRFTKRTVKIGDAVRWLPPDSRRRSGRRAGRHRGRHLPEQRALTTAAVNSLADRCRTPLMRKIGP